IGPVTVFRWRAEAGWPIEYVSKTVSQFGFDGGELIRRQALFSSLIHKDDLQRVEQAKIGETDGRFMSHGFDYRIVRANGDVRWVYDYTIPVRDGLGEITHYAGYLLDITDRKQADFELHQEKERAQVTLHSIGDAVITTDVNGQVEYLNQAAEQLTGWENSIARGLPFNRVFSLFDDASRAGIEKPVSQALQTGSVIRSTHDCVLRRHDGRKLSIQYSISPIMSHGDDPLGVVLVFHDVTENRSMARQLDYQSTHDPLTGLINRAEFESRLKNALDSAREENDQHILCHLDLDQFKIINDTCCHTAGDTLLREMAGLLKGCLRDSDLLGRLGGDEFGLLLKNCTLGAAKEIAGNMLSIINASRFESCERTFEISASMGISTIDADSESVTSVMKQADLACYAAKDLGCNRYHIYQSSDRELARRHDEMQWVSRLSDAIDSDRLVLYFQDIVPVIPDAGARRHFEVLVRMLDEDGKLVMPDRFLPAAERYNLITALDRWVIAASFAWHASHGERLTMSINLSGGS
ncbi:MAG: diguanylate cyclase, partial [Pseudomonadota bacterium]|nr:diguanylate cyclase [Pseudomonadota bacterium]